MGLLQNRPNVPRHSTATAEENGSETGRPNYWYSTLAGLGDVGKKSVGQRLVPVTLLPGRSPGGGVPDTDRHCCRKK